jgi:DNA-binding NarL/FixJ family response regulator
MDYRPNNLTHLSQRELQVAWLVADGKSNREIANQLGFAETTAKFHVAGLLRRFGTDSRTKAAVMFTLERSDEAKERLA